MLDRPALQQTRLLSGLVLAVLVHVAAWLLLRLSPPPQTSEHKPVRLAIQLLAPTTERHPASAAKPALHRRPTSGLTPRAALATALPDPPGARHTPELAEPHEAVPTAAEARAPDRLNLSLPSAPPASGPVAHTMANQLRTDPRTHSEKRTVAWALADAAGTLPVTVQTSTDGLNDHLVRQGSKCTRVSAPRIATLHPMDTSSQGLPLLQGRCFRD